MWLVRLFKEPCFVSLIAYWPYFKIDLLFSLKNAQVIYLTRAFLQIVIMECKNHYISQFGRNMTLAITRLTICKIVRLTIENTGKGKLSACPF